MINSVGAMVRKYSKYTAVVLTMATMALSLSAGYAQDDTLALPAWSEGYLDIHFINAGKGESAFFVFPDGTTMLVDAGATARPKPRVTDQRPDSSRNPGEWIARYILQTMETLPVKRINYLMASHFHDDHIGEADAESPVSKSGAYRLSGLTEVGEYLPIDRIIDRGWPDYNWPVPLTELYVQNYIRFVKWSVENKKVRAERFRPGANDQLILLHRPQKFPDFEIRNIAANGEVWTGTGTNSRHHFPPLESLSPQMYPNENMCSIAFRLSYGKFDFYTGGDLIAGAPGQWQDIETQVGMVTGPVEVCVANHHGHFDAMGVPFLQAVRPRVHIIQAWSPSHPASVVLARMLSSWTYPGPRDVFSTNMMEETRVVIGDGVKRMKSQQGHIVVRVHPGGAEYSIYILDDTNERRKVKAKHGPYLSN